jgi:DNA-binding transcriptional regulator YiaG
MTPKQLKALRTRLKLSQREFGERVGVTKQSVYMWERGKTPIPKWLPALAGFLENPPLTPKVEV